MTKHKLLWVLGLLVGGVLLVACGAPSQPEPLALPSVTAGQLDAEPGDAADIGNAAPPSSPLVIPVVPVDGGDYPPNLHNNHTPNEGRNVLLPGFSLAEVSNPMVFRDRIGFQIEVFDESVGYEDGAGVERVSITILDDSGKVVHSQQVDAPRYCAFGRDGASCAVWDLVVAGYRWPGGDRVRPGEHKAQIVVKPQSGEAAVWWWTFGVEVPQQYLSP